MSAEDARRLLLRSELTREWDHVRKSLADAGSVDPGTGKHAAAFVALALDHGYQAFESLLLRLEKGLGLPARTGDTWHRALLADAAKPIQGLRPSVYPDQAEDGWAEMLRFRHFLRHAYAVELDPAKLRSLVQRLSHSVNTTSPSLQTLIRALE